MHDDGTYVRKKQGTTWQTRFGRNTRRYFEQLAQTLFLRLLQQVTGIGGLLPDPYNFGGGLQATGSGGRLAVHADFNRHPVTRMDRRLNLLVYLNEGWTAENGGALELWDAAMQQCVVPALPEFNRTVLFSTTSTSFHGQPEPVVGPPDLWRRSLALYCYSCGRPEESGTNGGAAEHSTLWQQRPERGF